MSNAHTTTETTMPNQNLFTLEELLALPDHAFDGYVEEVRDHIAELEGDMQVQRRLTDIGVPTALGMLDNLRRIRDDEVQNLQRMAYAFELRNNRMV